MTLEPTSLARRPRAAPTGVVTGPSGDIGGAIPLALAEQGAAVCVVHAPPFLMQPRDVAETVPAHLRLPRAAEVTETRMRPLVTPYSQEVSP